MNGRFPTLSLAVNPPLAPMEAEAVSQLPTGAAWQYEPKWDGFRCVAFRDGRTVVLQAKNGEPLTRYFPELVIAVAGLPSQHFVLDGEIVVFAAGGRISYDDLLQRIHPSARRVAQLSARTPATYLVFDLLAEGEASLLKLPLVERRKRLEKFFKGHQAAGVHLSPATMRRTEALGWLRDLEGAGLDGLMAKRKDAPYEPGARTAMVKIKTEHTCDCVVGGFRRNAGGEVPVLLLGLYDEEGRLDYVGATEPLPEAARRGVEALVAPLIEPPGFTGRSPGGEGRTAKARDFEPLRSALVCEVRYDRFGGDRFRGSPTFVRWRPDKKPQQCTFDQVRPSTEVERGFDLIGL